MEALEEGESGAGDKRVPEEARIRILQPDEFAKFFQALDMEPDQTFRDFSQSVC